MTCQDPQVSILCWGNSSRGDDALGEEIYRALLTHPQLEGRPGRIRLIYDQQLTYEHTLDLLDASLCLFIDASLSCPAPYCFLAVEEITSESLTTHQLSPEQLIHIAKSTFDKCLPSYLLQIRGYDFNLGNVMSAQGKHNMMQALQFLDLLLSDCAVDHWHQQETLEHA